MLEKIKKISFAGRINFLIGVAALVFCICCFLLINYNKKCLYNEKFLNIKNLVEAAWGVIDQQYKLSQDGVISESSAQEVAGKIILNMKYEKKEYFWINDMEPKMIQHPYYLKDKKPKWYDPNGLASVTDPNGKKMFVEFVKLCKIKDEGLVDYYWTLPGEEDGAPVPKVSYVKAFKPWGWIVGSGIYLDNVGKEINNLIEFMVLIGIGLLFFIVASLILVTRKVIKPMFNSSSNLIKGSSQLTGASSEIALASQKMAEGAHEQAASLDETSAALQEISSIAKKNVENCKNAVRFINDTSSMITDANGKIGNTSNAMTEIVKSSQEIGKIIRTIDEIAFQTNLLALNAAVEAARAGDSGLGFAVVAEEVRSLAQRSAQSAKETQLLIEEVEKKINNGNESAQSTTQAFSGVVDSIIKITSIINEISTASEDQSYGVENIEKALKQIEILTQNNITSSQNTALSAAKLNSLSEYLISIVEDLNQVIKGKHEVLVETEETGTKQLEGKDKKKEPAKLPKKGADLKKKITTKEIKPEDVIPLDKDDYKDFKD
ncbi:MAG: cache domain-containing protein [Spirochaetes bacterium]|nr:cache domain-containing protein [Spirochaetota bacterium]